VEEATDLIWEKIFPVIDHKKVVFVGFSVGALFILKLWGKIRSHTMDAICIAIGTFFEI
jgi:dienelactone hydrolase